MTEWTNEFGVTLSVDKTGRKHRDKGAGGGQFTKDEGNVGTPPPKPPSKRDYTNETVEEGRAISRMYSEWSNYHLNQPKVLRHLNVPKVMYHLAPRDRVDSIQANGLVVGSPTTSQDNLSVIRGVYLTSNPRSDIGGDLSAGNMVVVEIDTEGLDLRLDPEFFYADSTEDAEGYVAEINKTPRRGGWAMYSQVNIPPSHVKVTKQTGATWKPPKGKWLAIEGGSTEEGRLIDWVNEFGVTLSVDAIGREHRGKGVGGGQFAKGGENAAASAEDPKQGDVVTISPNHSKAGGKTGRIISTDKKGLHTIQLQDGREVRAFGFDLKVDVSQQEDAVPTPRPAPRPAPKPTLGSTAPSVPRPAPSVRDDHIAALRIYRRSIEQTESLTDEQKADYKRAIIQVMVSLPENAVSRASWSVQEVVFHPNTAKLTKVVARRYKNVREFVNEGCTIQGTFAQGEGRLDLDGLTHSSDTPELGGVKSSIKGVFAHEVGHAVDWDPEREVWTYSGTAKWKTIIDTEIGSSAETARLSQYATTNPQEAFAEFFRLVHGTSVDRATIERRFPMASAYLKENKLW